MTAISVGKRVDKHKPVVKSGGNLIRFVGFIFHPISAIVDELSKLVWDAIRVDTDVFV